MSLLKQLVKNIFQYEAKIVLKKYKPKIIAITGSVGKTLTRDITYSLISKDFFVRKSEKSFTAELGVPLTIIGCSSGQGTILDWLQNIFVGLWLIIKKRYYPEWLILEIDGDKPGDIEKISKWISPDILVITAIGEIPSHIESFGSDMDLFLKEKKYLVNSLGRESVIIYNGDDEITGRLLNDVNIENISCGLGKDCKIFGDDFNVLTSVNKDIKIPTGMSFNVTVDGKNISVTVMETIGISNEYAVLLSIGVANYLKIQNKDFAGIINKTQSLPGRMKIINGLKDTTILDDTYNSSPIAVKQAIDALFKVEVSGRKIAVIGDMFELGRFSTEEHKKIARSLRDVANICICVGLRARKISGELLDLGFNEENLYSFDYAEEAGKFLQNIIQTGDVILVKGSQSMRLEKVVEEIMRHPEDKEKLLVRQSEEWLNR